MKLRILTLTALMATRTTLGCGPSDAPPAPPAPVHGTLAPGAAAMVVRTAGAVSRPSVLETRPASERNRLN